MQLEKDVESYLRGKIEAAGGRCVKFIPDNNRGWPDRLILLPGGRVCWAELKRPQGGRLSPAQMVAHAELKKLGQQVVVVWSKDDARKLIELLTSTGTGTG